MNENEIQRIAAAANALRPDWPTTSLRSLLNRPELIHRPRRDVAIALVWVACDSETKTPARVIEAGPWWRAASAGSNEGDKRPQPPKPDEACATCGMHLDKCLGGHPTSSRSARANRTTNPTPYIEQARAALRGMSDQETP